MMMKKSLIAIILTLSLISIPKECFAGQQEFCNGFKSGYIAGYMRASGSNLDPLTPMCPTQPLKGSGEPKSDYEHGYMIGYEIGSKKI
ncbi:hypothetical protein FLL45_20890 [Aliikangiella marina]|uniref:Secreted protein n=1 Tax=Aliikangiella marina TaxID=1712262 RepID=A0A545T329_9GAMM|nr:hypothetical protein [Aliikangiella marina]TQV71609.1 hypothetical protein FLL45_20890 [Aliikangiella marina]